jgi:hypothetical protein
MHPRRDLLPSLSVVQDVFFGFEFRRTNPMRFSRALIGLVCAVPLIAWSQAKHSSSSPEPLKAPVAAEVPWPQTALNVLVLDRSKHPLPVTNPTALQVFEDGKPQTVASVTGPDTPMSLAVVIDISGSSCPERGIKPGASMKSNAQCSALNSVINSVAPIIKNLPSGSEVMIISFNDDPRLRLPFTPVSDFDPAALEAVLKPKGGTAFYTAILAAERYVASNARWKRRGILVITDGEDNASAIDLATTLAIASYPSCPLIYALNPANAHHEEYAGSELRHSEQTLETLVQACGGAVLPAFDHKGKPFDLQDLSAALASQIAINYTASDNAANGQPRKVEVRMQAGPPDAQIRSLHSYTPPSPR